MTNERKNAIINGIITAVSRAKIANSLPEIQAAVATNRASNMIKQAAAALNSRMEKYGNLNKNNAINKYLQNSESLLNSNKATNNTRSGGPKYANFFTRAARKSAPPA